MDVEQLVRFAKSIGPVFPIKAGRKSPPIKGWQDWATQDAEKIRAHWKTAPHDNAGFHAEGYLILDVDTGAGKDGLASLRKLEEEHGKLPATLTVRTPTGGEHRYFKLPPGADLSNSANKLSDALDIRTRGGYVVVPGSRTDQGSYVFATPGIKPAQAPDWLLQLVSAARRPERAEADAASIIATDVDAAVARAKDFLRSHAVAVEGHGGDHHTFRTVCRIRDFGVPEERAAEALEDWNARCEPPWEAADLAVKIANAYQYAQDAAGKLTPEALGFEVVSDGEGAKARAAESQTPTAVQSATEATSEAADVVLQTAEAAELPKVWTDNYIVKGWLWRGIDAQIFGHTNVGKTFLALHLAVHVAAGAPWFGQRVRQGGVLYLGYEGLMALPRRLAALRTRYPDLPWKTMPFAWVGMNAPLVAERVQDQNELSGRKRLQAAILKFAEKYGAPPALVIVDTYSRAISGSASDEGLAGKFASMARALADRNGTTVLRIHHPGHSDAQRARGSYAIGAGLDVDIRVSQGLIEAPKQRDAEKNRLGFMLEIVALGEDQDGDQITSCAVVPAEPPADRGLNAAQKQLLAVIRAAAGSDGVAARESVREAARASGVIAEGEPGRKRLHQVLGQLEKRERVRCDEDEIHLLERGSTAMFDEAA